MKWDLVIDKGAHKGQPIPIRLSPFLIGRDNDCHLRPASPFVSHHHCALISQGKTMLLSDCNSTNGTFVNARRIKGQVELHPGDRLGIGSLTFVVSLKGQVAVNQQPPKSPSAGTPRVVSEEAIGAMLLKMDKEEVERKQPEAGRRWKMVPPVSGFQGSSSKDSETLRHEAAQENVPMSPSEVAAAILGKKSLKWLRQKAGRSTGSEETALR